VLVVLVRVGACQVELGRVVGWEGAHQDLQQQQQQHGLVAVSEWPARVWQDWEVLGSCRGLVRVEGQEKAPGPAAAAAGLIDSLKWPGQGLSMQQAAAECSPWQKVLKRQAKLHVGRSPSQMACTTQGDCIIAPSKRRLSQLLAK
jgi:hypothetical protein